FSGGRTAPRASVRTSCRFTGPFLAPSRVGSLESLPLNVFYRIDIDRGRAFARLSLSDAETGVPARVSRSAEADLVPRPGVGIERAQDRPRDHRPRLLWRELIPHLPVQRSL